MVGAGFWRAVEEAEELLDPPARHLFLVAHSDDSRFDPFTAERKRRCGALGRVLDRVATRFSKTCSMRVAVRDDRDRSLDLRLDLVALLRRRMRSADLPNDLGEVVSASASRPGPAGDVTHRGARRSRRASFVDGDWPSRAYRPHSALPRARAPGRRSPRRYATCGAARSA